MRCLLLLLPVFACCAFAQGTINLSGTAPPFVARHLLVALDHGASAQAVTVDCSLTTTSMGGIWLFLYDWETYCANAANFGDLDTRSNAGGVDTTVTTPARAGVQYIVVQILANPVSGLAAPYTGSLMTSAGTATLEATQDYNLISHPRFAVMLERVMLADQPLGPSAGTFSAQVILDAGPTPVPVTFRVFFAGDEVSAFTVYDDNATPPTALYTFSGPDFMSHDEVMTTPAYSGQVKIRVVLTASGAGGAANTLWELDAPSVSPIVSVLSLDPPPASPKRNGDECSVGPGGASPAGVAGVGLMAAAMLRGRRRPKNRQ